MCCAVARSRTKTTQTTTTSKASISAADGSSDKKTSVFSQKSKTNRNSGYDTTRPLTPGTTIYVQNSQATPAGAALNRGSRPPLKPAEGNGPASNRYLEHDLFGKPVPTFPDHALEFIGQHLHARCYTELPACHRIFGKCGDGIMPAGTA
jgi:hypothetical protein